MTLDVVIDGRPAKLTLETARLRYRPEGGETIEREYSLEEAGPGAYSVLIEGRRFLVSLPLAGQVSVNGRSLAVEVFDPREMRARTGGGERQGGASVSAPMPGKVVRVLVEPGDTVEAGQGLVVVEAMKMQNEMKSPKAGRVAEVRTRAEATVVAGEILMVIE
jgi:biotin carboxyl carrier protein